MPLTATDTVRYVGVADWWGRHVWIERDGVRSALHALRRRADRRPGVGLPRHRRARAGPRDPRRRHREPGGRRALLPRHDPRADRRPAARRLRARPRRSSCAGSTAPPRRPRPSLPPASSSACTEDTLSSSVCSRSRRSSSLRIEYTRGMPISNGTACSSPATARMSAVEPSSEVPIACIAYRTRSCAARRRWISAM